MSPLHLPVYPSTQIRKALSPSQLATINQTISGSLRRTLAHNPSTHDASAVHAYIASYAKDTAVQVLEGLIWEPPRLSKDEILIRKLTLVLNETLAPSGLRLGIQDLLDLSIIYASTNVSRMKSVFAAALKVDPTLIRTIETDLVPAFTQLCSPSQGLYAIRKASHCIVSFLQSSPDEILRCFGYNKQFILALATLYDQGLTSIAHSYGGLSTSRNPESSVIDEWEPIWVQTKVSLIDTFHLIVSTLLKDRSASGGESDHLFDILFALLERPASSSDDVAVVPTPYLNRALLVDYQDAYSLLENLASTAHAAEKDARLDLLESALQSFAVSLPPKSTSNSKDPGILKILLRSNTELRHRGEMYTVDPAATSDSSSTGKGKDPVHIQPSSIPDIVIKTTQVLDILPEHRPEYIRALLEHPRFKGDPEKVVEALLEGTAPGDNELNLPADADGMEKSSDVDDTLAYVRERRNVFDDDVMDLTRLRVGKMRGEDESTVLRDRTFIEQMKADILRRVEDISDDEETGVELGPDKGKRKGVDLAFDDEDDISAPGNIKISGDGEESGESDGEGGNEDEDGATSKPQSLEIILELAYLRDPKLFDRDAQTRRSKARSELKVQTGWGDEQIEGWRIMLERNPRKDKILEKHEFAGNRNRMDIDSKSSQEPISSDQGQGRGRGRGERGGRGRGGRGGSRGRGGGISTGDGASSGKERAWKDKNKASQGNHNRKRGHDKKMARVGAGPSI